MARQQRKVFSDILGHSMARQPADNRDQWRSLHTFHTTFTTADTFPAMPISLAPPAGEAETIKTWTTATGMPVSWEAAWQKLAFRFPRPHQPASQ
eukprot:4191005-Pleurochrysis_carterae.AAC.1